jgi:hypothetical protein
MDSFLSGLFIAAALCGLVGFFMTGEWLIIKAAGKAVRSNYKAKGRKVKTVSRATKS